MITLRDDQVRRLEGHQERALGAIAVISATYRGEVDLREVPEGRSLLAEPRALLASVAVAAAGANETSRRVQAQAVEGIIRLDWEDFLATRILQALRRRRLPFEPEDVELVLDLGTSTIAPDSGFGRAWETLSFGTSAASRLLREQPGAPPVVAALGRAGAAIDDLGIVAFHTYGVTPIRSRIRALLAANVPGGLVDLSAVSEKDAWGPAAADALRLHAMHWERAQDFLALLTRATASRPTKAWRRESAELAAGYPGYGELLRSLLEPVLEIDLTPSGVGYPPAWLLASENEILARGAAWAAVDVAAEEWVVPLLGQLALRGASPSPHPGVTIAVAQTVAGGAIEALSEIGTGHAHDELCSLLGTIERRDVLKRIAKIVGEDPAETAARDRRLRLVKERAVRRKMREQPRAPYVPSDEERAYMDSIAEHLREALRQAGVVPDDRSTAEIVRQEVAPALRAAGFTDSSGRTFWRVLDDRVERAHCKVHKGGLTLELGIWLRFVPRPYTSDGPKGTPRPSEYCDLQGRVHAWDVADSSLLERAEAWFGRWRPLPVLLRWLLEGTGTDDAFTLGAPGAPSRRLVAGYVAREIGEDKVARENLRAAARAFRSDEDQARTPEWLAWFEQLEADADVDVG